MKYCSMGNSPQAGPVFSDSDMMVYGGSIVEQRVLGNKQRNLKRFKRGLGKLFR
jgi:hypothetical protein